MTFVDRFVSQEQLWFADGGVDKDIAQARAAIADPDPDVVPDVTRADLVFYGVAHSRGSYEGRVFLNNPDADADTPKDFEHGYAGSFSVFGHEVCAGDAGHCDPTWSSADDQIDFRRPHHMLPETAVVNVTQALRNIPDLGEAVTVTVVPVRYTASIEIDKPPLRFDKIRLLTYE